MKKPLIDEQSRAFLQAGLLRPVDAVFGSVICLAWITLFNWTLFGSPTAVHIIAVLIVMVLFVQLWSVLLILRVARFTLLARADINTMPMQAAKLLSSYALGTPAPKR